MDVAPNWSQRKYWDFFIMPEVSALLPKEFHKKPTGNADKILWWPSAVR